MVHGTTILSVRRGQNVAIAGDGQVTMGNTVLKRNARKIRKMYNDRILAGFSGATADAFTLFEKFEGKIEASIILVICPSHEPYGGMNWQT